MLEAWIRQLRAMGAPDVEIRIAKEGAKGVKAALVASLTAGTSPEGDKWAPRKKDGGRAYAAAAAALEVVSNENLIRATITGPTAYGPYGVRGAPKRAMLPDAGGGIPAGVDKALDAAAAQAWEDLTK